MNLNPHYHLIGLDGWFVRNDDGSLVFHRAAVPTQRDVERLPLDLWCREAYVLLPQLRV